MAVEAVTTADLRQIQGLVYSAWNTLHSHAAFIFVRLSDSPVSARAWLAALSPHLTPVSRADRKHEHRRYQVALAASGLSKLGAPQTVTDALPEEATAGMWTRKKFLGDDDAPLWEFGDAQSELDAVVLLYARDDRDRAALVAEETARIRATGGTLAAPVQYADQLVGREHFGFADGLSQPFLRGPAEPYSTPRPGQLEISPGEILLGYQNAYGRIPAAPKWTARADDTFARNGTYLVFRKLEQDVPALWQWLARQAETLTDADRKGIADPVKWLAAKVMGRWTSGTSLVDAPDADVSPSAASDPNNNFNYHAQDPDGLRCPIASHVRRANPRDARGSDAADSLLVVERHRIVRRGRSYGTPITPEQAMAHVAGANPAGASAQPRGLYFMCLQASIARGFEFIQQSWLSSSGFNSLHDEVDPITGHAQRTGDVETPRFFTIPREPLRIRLTDVPRVVHTRGGGYFFMPSLPAVQQLAGLPHRQ